MLLDLVTHGTRRTLRQLPGARHRSCDTHRAPVSMPRWVRAKNDPWRLRGLDLASLFHRCLFGLGSWEILRADDGHLKVFVTFLRPLFGLCRALLGRRCCEGTHNHVRSFRKSMRLNGSVEWHPHECWDPRFPCRTSHCKSKWMNIINFTCLSC